MMCPFERSGIRVDEWSTLMNKIEKVDNSCVKSELFQLLGSKQNTRIIMLCTTFVLLLFSDCCISYSNRELFNE